MSLVSSTDISTVDRENWIKRLFPSYTKTSTGLAADIAANMITALGGTPTKVAEYTNAPTRDVAGLQAATATTVAPRTVLAAAMLAPGLAELLARPCNVTITTAGVTAADAPATALVTGTGPDGAVQTETLTVPQTATIVLGAKCFKTIVSVAYAAADGTDATNAIGFGQKFALPAKAKVRAGRVNTLSETADGALVTTGTFATPTTSPPYGSYSPSAAPDGAKDYAVTYELDQT